MWSVMFVCSGPKHRLRQHSRRSSSMAALTPWAKTSSEKEGVTSKRVAVGSEKFQMKGIQILTKLCLKNSMDVRELQAASLVTIQLPKDCMLVSNKLQATKAYNVEQDKAKQTGGSLPEGQPHCHAWIALLETLNQIVSEPEKDIIQKHVKECCSSPAMVASFVHVCRIKKCFDQTKMKLCLAVSESAMPIVKILEDHLKDQGGSILQGAKRQKGG